MSIKIFYNCISCNYCYLVFDLLKSFFLNVSLWFSIITFSIVIFSENIFEKSNTLYDLLITFVSIILTICYYWFTSIKAMLMTA